MAKKKPKRYSSIRWWWWSARQNPVKSATAVLALLASIGTTYAQSDNLSGAFLHVWPPSTAYAQSYTNGKIAEHVRTHVAQQAPLLDAVRDLQIEGAEGKRDAAKEAKAKWLLERGKTQDASTHDLIDNHIGELDTTIVKLNSQIRTLNRVRGN